MPGSHAAPAARPDRTAAPDTLTEAALAFAVADCRWRLLRASRLNWGEPDGQYRLAAAFVERRLARRTLEHAAALSD